MADYFELPGLEQVVLEDSWVTAIVESDGALRFELEAVLTERHPLWRPRRAGEQYCYRTAVLEFRDIERAVWLDRTFQPTTDPDGTVDLGNIDAFSWETGVYALEGDGWSVQIHSGQPPLIEIGRPPKFSTFPSFRETVEVLAPEQALAIRQAVLARHLEPRSDERDRRLGVEPEGGRLTYRGYIWDYLAGRRLATEAEVWALIDREPSVFVMWDLHEIDRVPISDYFRFPIGTILQTTPETLRSGKHYLPEDLYIFASPATWIGALTHEDIEGRPFCLLAGDETA